VVTAALPRQKTSFYRPELDALRFFAFSAVFADHIFPHSPDAYTVHGVPHSLAIVVGSSVKAGSFGVPLFFLLSAYLITTLLLREKTATGDVHLRSFYVRRILRIWPLYFLALAVAVLWPMKADRLQTKYILGYVFLAGNWAITHYGWTKSFAAPLWSVSIEEQFYLLWPVVAKYLRRRALMWSAVGLLILANLYRLHIASTGPRAGYSIWPDTFVQLDSIALGILCALILPDQWKLRRFARVGLFTLGILCWVLCGYLKPLFYTPLYTLLAFPALALGALVIFLSVYGVSMRGRLMPYLGKISYGLYVFHAFSIYLVNLALKNNEGTPLRVLIFVSASFTMTLGLAMASYHWYEAPFLRLKRRFTFVQSRPV